MEHFLVCDTMLLFMWLVVESVEEYFGLSSNNNLSMTNWGAFPYFICIAGCIGAAFFAADMKFRMARYEDQISGLLNHVQENVESKHRQKRELVDTEIQQYERAMTESSDTIQRGCSDCGDLTVNGERPHLEPFLPPGVVYTRWGRRDCPENNTSDRVYRGYAAGSRHSNSGGGAAFMCLYNNIDYEKGKFVKGFQGTSYLYGVEFMDSDWINDLFDVSGTESGLLRYNVLPCAVCIARVRISQVMIPGRDTCPHGWIKEYAGYIMAGGHTDKHPSQYICVDESPQAARGTSGTQNGAYLHMVEIQCTSHVCEPHVSGRELRCVVCTI